MRVCVCVRVCACVVCHDACRLLTQSFGVRQSDLFAYKNKEQFGTYQTNLSGFSLYDPQKEFARLQLSADAWRITNSNYDFRFPRFPNQFIVPEKMSDGTAGCSFPAAIPLGQSLDHSLTFFATDAINTMWKSPLKWRRWTLALCWRSAQTKACLLRSAKVLVAEEARGVTADFDADRAPKQSKDARKHRSMLQQLLLLHEDSRAVHVFITSVGAKKKSRSDTAASLSIKGGSSTSRPLPTFHWHSLHSSLNSRVANETHLCFACFMGCRQGQADRLRYSRIAPHSTATTRRWLQR